MLRQEMKMRTCSLLFFAFIWCITISEAYIFDFEYGTLEDNNLQTPCQGMGKWDIVNQLPEGVPNPGDSKGFISPELPQLSCVNTIMPLLLKEGKKLFRIRVYLTHNASDESRVAVTISQVSGKDIFNSLTENTNGEWLDKEEEFDVIDEGDYSVQILSYNNDAVMYIDEFEVIDQETTTTDQESTTTDQESTTTAAPFKDFGDAYWLW